MIAEWTRDLDEAGVIRLADLLALKIVRGDVIGLRGEVGAGKTTLARALIAALLDDCAAEVPSPTHRDLYVELDCMAQHQPMATAIADVVAAFAAAPIANPDGTQGVRLHIIVDEQATPAQRAALDVHRAGIVEGDGGTVRDRLIRAASDEIEERGTSIVQMEAVAKRAGVSRATAFRCTPCRRSSPSRGC